MNPKLNAFKPMPFLLYYASFEIRASFMQPQEFDIDCLFLGTSFLLSRMGLPAQFSELGQFRVLTLQQPPLPSYPILHGG